MKGYRKTVVVGFAILVTFTLAQQGLMTSDVANTLIEMVAAFTAANLWGDHRNG